VAEALKNRVHVHRLFGIRHRVLQCFELVMQIADASASRDRFVKNGTARHFFYVLPKVADRESLRNGHVALIERLLAGDHAKERRLADAVQPDQADLLAWIQLKRRVDEKDLPTVLLVDPRERNHNGSILN